jgi:hypothetical protein
MPAQVRAMIPCFPIEGRAGVAIVEDHRAQRLVDTSLAEFLRGTFRLPAIALALTSQPIPVVHRVVGLSGLKDFQCQWYLRATSK